MGKVSINFGRAACLGGWLSICGCEMDTWHSGVDEYSARASRIFGASFESPKWQPDERLRYPSRRQLRLPVPSSSVSLIDFLRISKCDLQRLVGERNSGLGKVIQDSQLIEYTVEFIRLAQVCLNEGKVPDELVDDVTSLVSERENALPRYFWNALFASAEFAGFFSLNLADNPSQNDQIPTLIELAFGQIQAQVDAHLNKIASEFNPVSLEPSLAVLASSNYAGAIVDQQAQLANHLTAVNRSLTSAWKAKPLCVSGSDGKLLLNPKHRSAIKHILENYYIAQVQRVASNLLRQSDQLSSLIAKLISVLGYEHPEFTIYWQRVWLDEVESSNQRLRHALASQTNFWQGVLADCKMSPK